MTTLRPVQFIYYITAHVNGSGEMRLGDHIFNENAKCIAVGHCQYNTKTACAFISKVTHSEDYATSSGDGSMLSVDRDSVFSGIYLHLDSIDIH